MREAMGNAANIHATCVALGEAGILLRGPSGAGKSDLALRLIEAGAKLVADDRVVVLRDGDRLIASAPDALEGLIEVRGLGIVRLAPGRLAPSAALALVCDLVGAAEVDRLPEPSCAEILGIRLPRLALDPFEAASALKLRLAAGAGPGFIMVGA
ncbi:MAG: hypothetical protein RL477_825 [Pseudomonadota bacterium]|jgi:serine kinase of HPr protein (carbohydrate metabolism regulator)